MSVNRLEIVKMSRRVGPDSSSTGIICFYDASRNICNCILICSHYMTHHWLDRYLAVSWGVEYLTYCKRNKQIALWEGKKCRCNRDCPDFGASVRINTGLMWAFCQLNKYGKMLSNNAVQFRVYKMSRCFIQYLIVQFIELFVRVNKPVSWGTSCIDLLPWAFLRT
jgi:hypothetical protein